MTGGVASVTNLIIYADTLVGANIEVRPDKSERNVLCQVRFLNTGGFDRDVRQICIPHQEGMRSHTNEVQQIEDVPLDALRRRRGMGCTQWKVDDTENKDGEVVRADHGRRRCGRYRTDCRHCRRE